MYKANTQYDGFRTLQVFNNEDGSQYLWLDNGDHKSLIWTDGVQSVHIKDKAK